MNKHVRTLLFGAFILFLSASGNGLGEVIEWGTANQQLYASDGMTLLPGHRTRDESSTGLIQLLYLGENGTYDAPNLLTPGIGGDGAFGDDLVIAQSWVGDKNVTFDPDAPGQFTASEQAAAMGYTSGVADFAIRVFDTAVPDQDWTSGNIPTSGHYNYTVFTNPTKTPEPGFNYTLWINNPLATTREVIPEPTSLLLMCLGLTSLLVSRIRVL